MGYKVRSQEKLTDQIQVDLLEMVYTTTYYYGAAACAPCTTPTTPPLPSCLVMQTGPNRLEGLSRVSLWFVYGLSGFVYGFVLFMVLLMIFVYGFA